MKYAVNLVGGVDTPQSLQRLRESIDRVEKPEVEARSREQLIEDFVPILESIYTQREKLMEMNQKIWDRYVEDILTELMQFLEEIQHKEP